MSTLKKTKPLALSAFARDRRVSEGAVRAATATGRLERSLVSVRGRWKIADLDLARQEWVQNVNENMIRGPRP
jgi:hypothetical protein